METEWAIHVLNREIDQLLIIIRDEQNFVGRSKVSLHYHTSPKTLCTEEMEERHGGCCGVSPFALLKKTLEERLAQLNVEYPTSPLPEIE